MTGPSPSVTPENAFWQSSRMPPALDPTGTAAGRAMDARSIGDMIRWAEGMARGLTYFDAQGQAHVPTDDNAPWAAFWRNDVVFLLAEICAQTPHADYRRHSEDMCEAMQNAALHVDNILNWQKRATKLAALTAPDSVETALLGVLANAARNELYGALPHTLAPADLAEQDAAVQEMFRARDPVIRHQFTHDDHIAANHDAVYSLVTRVVGQIISRAHELLDRALSDKSDHPPQIGLFLAFLEMFRHAQGAMNGLAERHLDFYYHTVLGLAPCGAIADHADVAFVSDPTAGRITIAQGSNLVVPGGGSDPIVFATDRALDVTPMQLRAQHSIAISRAPQRGGGGTITRARAFPITNSLDGHGAPLPPDAAAWPCFGPADPRVPGEARIGFALGAAVLAAPSGARRITVSLEFADGPGWRLGPALNAYRDRIANSTGQADTETHLMAELARALMITVTAGAQTNVAIDQVKIVSDTPQNRLELLLHVRADAPAIAPDPLHPVCADVPVLEIALAPDAPFYALSVFSGATIAQTQISLDVTGCRTFAISTTTGDVDPEKPFAPFGPFATSGAALFVDSPVLRHPGLTQVGLHLGWSGLPIPPDNFTSHYAAYDLGLSADSYRVALEINAQDAWHLIGGPEPDQPLFEHQTPSRVHLKPFSHFGGPLPRAATRQAPPSGAPALRLTLRAPDVGFGQGTYPNVLTAHALAQAAKPTGLRALFSRTRASPPPKPPLDPQVSDLTLSYRARQSGRPGDANAPIRFLSMTPLGQMVATTDGVMLDDLYDYAGAMLLGFDGITAPMPVSVLFDIDETTAPPWSPNDDFAYPRLEWRYFNGSRWRPLGDAAILDDGTRSLSRPGIVQLALPPDMRPGDRYPGGLLWLAVTVHGDPAHYGLLRGIYPNAVPVTRRPDAREPVLPAQQLSRLETPIEGIKSLTQPRHGRYGRSAETTEAFRLRVSERLGHKSRAIVPQDYGRLILQHFPDVAQVSMITRTSGRLDVIVSPARVPFVNRPSDVAYWRRAEIARWLQDHTGIEHRRILVRNPDFEPIRVTARIAMDPKAPPGILGRVATAIDAVIAPWLAHPDAPLPIGASRLDTAALTAALEDIPGVSGVAGLGGVQLFRTPDHSYHLKDTSRSPNPNQRRILTGSGPASVLIPAPAHDLDFLPPRRGLGDLTVAQDFYLATQADKQAYETGALPIPTAPRRFGIGRMTIGQDLVLAEPTDTIAATTCQQMTSETAAFAPLFEQGATP